MTSNDADIGKWVIQMTVTLTGYPLVKIDEYFSVEIGSCILNSLTLDAGTAYNAPSSSPFVFTLY